MQVYVVQNCIHNECGEEVIHIFDSYEKVENWCDNLEMTITDMCGWWDVFIDEECCYLVTLMEVE